LLLPPAAPTNEVLNMTKIKKEADSVNKDPSTPQESNVISGDMVGLALSDTSHSKEDDSTRLDTNATTNSSSTAEKETLTIDESSKTTTSLDIEEEDDLKSTLAANQRWILKSRPDGTFNASTDIELVNDPLDPDNLKANEVIIRVDVLAIDPFIRNMMNAKDGSDNDCDHDNDRDHDNDSIIQVNGTLKAMGVGTVIKGETDTFVKGSVVVGIMAAAKYAIVDNVLMQDKITFAKPSDSLGLLGNIGETAYIGTFVVPNKSPQRGETVLVNDAASPVGCLVSQMAKFAGAKVIGITRGQKKIHFLERDLKLHGLIDSKESSEQFINEALSQFCPDGIDFVFDNDGGPILDDILNHINTRARIVTCDLSSYHDKKATSIQWPKNYIKLIEKSACIHGFNTMDYPEHSFKAMTYMGWNYIRDNFIFPQKFRIGLESFAECIEILMLNEHVGRLLVQVSDQFENIDQHKQQKLENKVVNNDEEQTEHININEIKSASVNSKDEITREQHANLIDLDYDKKSEKIEVTSDMNQVTESLFRLAIEDAEPEAAVQPLLVAPINDRKKAEYSLS
jgi:hypothetical protein